MTEYPTAPQPGYGPVPPANHPQATTVLVLGIVGLVVCGVCAPIAWVMGNRVVAEIDAAGGTVGGRDQANIGRILGIVGTVVIILAIIAVIAVFVFGGVLAVSSSTSG